MARRFKTPGNATPRSNRRGCLCANGTYSTKCCDGSLQAQGIGSLVGEDLLITEAGANLQQENGNNIKV